MMTLHREFEVYQTKLPELLATQAGKYVVIKGKDIVGVRDTYAEALDWAYDKFGLQHFFVKEIAQPTEVAHFSRDHRLCGR
jgi:hypothetical protein